MFADWLKLAVVQQPETRVAASAPKDVVRAVERRCIICSRSPASSFVVHGYRLFACSRCDYAFIDPSTPTAVRSKDIFDDAYFSGGGAGYANYCDEAHLLRAHGNRYGGLLRAAGARHVLDVGAAAGFILRGLIDAGCSGVGIEPNASMATYAANVLAVDVRATTLEEFEPRERFDAVAMLQIVDHFDDIRLSFARVRDLTRSGGWCLIEFGNRASLTARILGTAWHEYAPPSVQRVFSLRALRLLLADYGFILRRWGRPAKYLRADHALSLLRYKTTTPIGRALLARLTAAIPGGATVRYLGDDITWALFEKHQA